MHSHEAFERQVKSFQERAEPFVMHDIVIVHKYSHALYGAVVEGMSQRELEELDYVDRVVPNTKKYLKRVGKPDPRMRLTRNVDSEGKVHAQDDEEVYTWGLDRIDQEALPLDHEYEPAFTGSGVDVYIVDTGLDTLHHEFTQNPAREVKNVYSSYSNNKLNPGVNTDGEGHGTHCAGTIGGATVGVSPNANMYGLKVLSDAGEGDTGDIAAALDYVAQLKAQHGRPAVVSMSLGGGCETANCAQDTLVVACDNLANLGIVVSVAAGNEGCNACTESPSASNSALRVGASDIHDDVTYFSNSGHCVDIFAPGLDIISACASSVCPNEVSYQSMSGTSMACPHVTGVVAQLFEVNPSFTFWEIRDALTCDAVQSALTLDGKDTVTKNLLLQSPQAGTNYATCDFGVGCEDDCNGNGVCMPEFTSGPLNQTIKCHCFGGYYGDSCAATSDPNCAAAHNTLHISLYDSYGDGWTFTNFAIENEIGEVVDDAFDSLCYGDNDMRSYCLPDGQYQLEVSHGFFPSEVSWSMCGVTGGAPYSIDFGLLNGHCEFLCDGGAMVDLVMKDAYGDGWSGVRHVCSINDSRI